ncbi:PadR family transcriptional regulator [Nocardioides mangrovicus]|uniref:PadR family transcriptional regulator n=1 Tax=Nocardioides mangrovicus TaxID=2478913 RepID=A0A3L8P3J5_9ACTN|nr:PadR family transcriptional regulator [Nocardioides mangrovicus]RLV49592.1 PadR family transcriptional regulator [Nocardioides mangrovicus]
MGRHHFTQQYTQDELAEFARRRNRGGFGPGPGFGGPPWLAEMFNQGGRGRGRHGFGGPGGPGGRGPRARRGDVRAAILDVLAEDRGENATPLNGYAVIQRIAERTEGVWKPSPGSVYPTVSQLEDEELVVQREDGSRKTLHLTDAGRAYVAEHPEEMAAVWAPFAEEQAEDGSADLKKVIGQTMAAVWQLASTGTTAQVEQAAEVLAETRRKLYTILAEGDPQ